MTPDTGLVKYEMVGSQHIIASTGQPWLGINRSAFPDVIVEVYPNHVEGTVLLQLLGDGLLKVETFSGLRSDQVDAFTANAMIYER